MYVGVLLGLWVTPHMSVGHALMAASFTLYILIAMRYEERDLTANFGASYQAWREGAIAVGFCPEGTGQERADRLVDIGLAGKNVADCSADRHFDALLLASATTAAAECMPSLTDFRLPRMSLSDLPSPSAKPSDIFRDCWLEQVRIRSPRPESPFSVSGLAPMVTPKRIARQTRA